MSVVLENVRKVFTDPERPDRAVTAVDGLSLEVKEGELVTFLGPSGCGKTTALRIIAGFENPTSGRVLIGGQDVTHLPPHVRNTAMVFQSYAIFPHMKVYDNIAFGLKMKRVDRTVVKQKVQHAAELLHIEDFLDRYPSQMSGGQRQRVAVARAIAYDAEVLLMDEPLSNLDALLRLRMRAELKSLLNQLGTTTIYVTHDQIEALSMGDRIAVMRAGEILQYDSPTRIYDVPSDQFVGGFIGNPPMNFIDAEVRRENGVPRAHIDGFVLNPVPEMTRVLNRYEGRLVVVGIRAENMEALPQPADDALRVKVDVVEPLGAQNLLTIRVGSDVIKLSTHPDFPASMGQDIWIRFPSSKIRWFDRDSHQAITPALEQASV
jgi:multiple sugar transport system ATP-binding protein